MTIEELKNIKKELGYANADVAALSGISLGTVNKIFSGQTKAPRRATLLALESVLARDQGKPSNGSNIYAQKKNPMHSIVAEGTALYNAFPNLARQKQQGEFTLEDYLAIPDEIRVELIDGSFYEMAAPNAGHQFIAISIGHQLMSYLEKKGGNCKPVLSPIDVQLDQDNKTVVQPDVVILCDPELLIKNGRVFGAPDFVLEILSHSTWKKDMFLKLFKYANAGVREYWIVDPKSKTVITYDLEHEQMLPETHTFTEKIPVKIWNNDCTVDFSKVYAYVKGYID